MLDSYTISGLALKIYLKDYYNNNIPNINVSSLYNDIKKAYYGGITEVYRPYGENLYYYDVNSLYPYAALNDMPGLNCTKENFIEGGNIDHLFGFFNCAIKAPLNGYLGLLPVRNSTGLIYPVGN